MCGDHARPSGVTCTMFPNLRRRPSNASLAKVLLSSPVLPLLACDYSCHYIRRISCRSTRSGWSDETAGDVNPLWYATSLFAFHIDDVSVAATSATNAIFLFRIPLVPIFILFSSSLLICGCRFEVWFSRHLPRWCICWTMLYRGMSVTIVAEIVDIFGREEGTSG